MKTGTLEVRNILGLHARAAAKVVHTASGFESKIRLSNGSESADAKGIMGLMMLAATKGTQLELETDGPDEDVAYEAIETLFVTCFGEDE